MTREAFVQGKLKEKSQIDSEKRNTKRENESRTQKKRSKNKKKIRNAEECLFETEMGKRRNEKKKMIGSIHRVVPGSC